MSRTKQILTVCLVAVGVVGTVWGDGMIVPVRRDIRVRGAWAVRYHHVSIKVRDQVASVSIDQEFVNTGRGMIEVEYLFPVPPEAAIDAMTLLVNGKEFAAKLLKADEARKIYEDIVRKKKDPALLEYAGFGLIKTSAFPLEPNKPARVVVNYKNTCKKDQDTVEVWYPLNTEKFSAKPIDDVEVRVDIKSKTDVLVPYSPTHDIEVERKGPRHVVVTYHEKKTLPITDFQVFYRESSADVGATLLTHQPDPKRDGYFMLLVSPNPRTAKQKVVPKDVVIVFDHSGSMSGKKIDQAKEGIAFILNNLNKQDRFNVIAYSMGVEPFFEGLSDVTEDNLSEALDRLDRIDATGGTNIHGALLTGMKLLADRKHAERPAYMIFLTDGVPTVGERDEGKILKDTAQANTTHTRVFAFGVGYDVNIGLLDKLVRQNNGRSDYVKPKEPVETKVSSLYRKIKNPVMTDIKVRIEGLALRETHPRQVGDLFEGDQIVLVGRYEKKNTERLKRVKKRRYETQLVITGTYAGSERTFEYPVTIHAAGRRGGYDFVEKLWAIRRVGYLLDQIQLHGESKELVDEVIRLSKDYGIMTEYTAFLADETTPLDSPRRLREVAGPRLKMLESEITGAGGQRHAMNRQAFGMAMKAQPASKPAEGGSFIRGYRDKDSYEAGRVETVANVRQIGNQAVYRRGRTWITAEAAKMDMKQLEDKAKVIQRFSKEYFDLVHANSLEENQIFASQRADEELVIALRGQVYSIR